MATPVTIKYRAFLSYSHRDRAWGERLHKALESYRVDEDLVGRDTPAGPTPKTLRPIFRDREDFAAGHSLTAQTLAALEASQFLIVICSPNAAQSKYVNEEIRRFKVLGRGHRVIPVIVDGEPGGGGDPARECFPSALRFKVAPDGVLTEEAEEPIAADARSQGDDKELAKLKVIAGLLGVGLDEIVRRAQRARRRRNRIWASLAGVLLFLTVAATGSAVYAYQKLIESEGRLDQAIEIAYGFVTEATNLSDRYGAPVDMTVGLLKRAEAALNRLIEGGSTTPKLRHRKALMLLSFADNFELLGQTDEQVRRAHEAQALLEGLVGDQPGNIGWHRDLASAQEKVGNALIAQAMVEAAAKSYGQSLAIRERMAELDPDNLQWRKELSSSYLSAGDRFWDHGRARLAIETYQAGVVASLRVYKPPPRSISVSAAYMNVSSSRLSIGRAWLRIEGPTERPRASFRSALLFFDVAIAAVSNPTGSGKRPEDASISEMLGQIAESEGKLTEALEQYQESLAILDHLARDSRSASVKRAWARTYVHIGDILLKQGSFDNALVDYRKAFAIQERLTVSDAKNLLWQRELAVAHQKIGKVFQAQDRFSDALDSYRVALAAFTRLSATDRKNSAWQHDVAEAQTNIGDALLAEGKLSEAIEHYRSGFAVMEMLTAVDPGNKQWENERVNLHRKLAKNQHEPEQH